MRFMRQTGPTSFATVRMLAVQVGVAELPGSDVVMERQPRQLVRCTDRPGLCVAVAAKSITNSTEGNDKQEPVGQGAPEHLETEHTFNRAPMAGMVVSLGVNPAVDSNYRKATFNLINHIANSVYASEVGGVSGWCSQGPCVGCFWLHLAAYSYSQKERQPQHPSPGPTTLSALKQFLNLGLLPFCL